MPQLWPHQEFALTRLKDRLEPGMRTVLQCPTGGGKSRIATELIHAARTAALYTNRKLLLEQLGRVLDQAGIDYGIRAAGHPPALLRDVQLCSIPTEASQVLKRGNREVHQAELVIIDEAHLNKERTMCELIERHEHAALIGLTATPIGVGHLYDELIVAGTKEELRDCGALVPARVIAPDEPFVPPRMQVGPSGEFNRKEVRQRMMTKTIFGRVLDHWVKHNPDWLPTLLFAPDVKGSIYFAEQFEREGIPAAHIDGNNVWYQGEMHQSSPEMRSEILRASEAGELPVLCNRFVLREGINAPWLQHCILATMFGSPCSYVQSVGRMLRNHPGVDSVLIQDHGGNWHRHGDPNDDLEVTLDSTDYILASQRKRRLKERKEHEPFHCPQCDTVRYAGVTCPFCGYFSSTRSRMVVQTNGTLTPVQGSIYKKPRVYQKADAEKLWNGCYWRCKKAGMTFSQARGLFTMENGWREPPPELPLMPRHELDWYRRINDVARGDLH